MQNAGCGSILIWDEETEPPIWDGPIVLWSRYGSDPAADVYSLPELVDEHAGQLRARYLAFIHQIGQTRANGKSIIERLQLRPGFSYWWMTLIAQKDVYASSPHIYDALKLFAFEELARLYAGYSLRFRSRNRELALCLRAWCREEGRSFEWTKAANDAKTPRSKGFYEKLPPRMRAILSFSKFVAIRMPRVRASQSVSPATARPLPRGIAIFDIFTHLNSESLSTGVFASGYWSKLVGLLADSGAEVSWLHWFYPHPAVPHLPAARSLASKFSESSPSQTHQIVDERVSFSVVAKTVRDFVQLNRAESSLSGARGLFRPAGSKLNLWPLFRRDWAESFRGPQAIASLFHMNILDWRLATASLQEMGIYIQENQPWEFALNHFWRKYGHGLLIGVAHSTVPFWDLRYAFDPAAFDAAGGAVPIPGLVTLNGPNAIARFRESGYPADRYREVEALRYLYLLEIKRKPAAPLSTSQRLKLLVLGDLLPAYTTRQLTLLERCVSTFNTSVDVIFKPHPAAAPLAREIKLPNVRVSSRHISDELSECDAVFVGSATSSAADAYELGVPVISMSDGNRINFSPLYGLSDVAFVSSPEALAAALAHVGRSLESPYRRFFTLDESIPRWKSLIRGHRA